jgi:lysophospholipase L1-like esterase
MLMSNTLHLLCFGDSLTAGYSDPGVPFHPYTDALQASLATAFPSVNVTIDNHGLPGDQVTSPPGGFLPRMEIICRDCVSCSHYQC